VDKESLFFAMLDVLCRFYVLQSRNLMLRAKTVFRKSLPFAVLGILLAIAVYRVAWQTPSSILGG
jgi:hypothetical protein